MSNSGDADLPNLQRDIRDFPATSQLAMHLSTRVMISHMTSAHRQWMTSRMTSAHRQLLAEKQLNLEDLWRNTRMFP